MTQLKGKVVQELMLEDAKRFIWPPVSSERFLISQKFFELIATDSINNSTLGGIAARSSRFRVEPRANCFLSSHSTKIEVYRYLR